MGKKRKNNRKPKPTTILEVDSFYNVHDGSTKGHPGIITKANYRDNEYQSVVTETSNNKGDNIPLIHPTDNRVEKSFIKPRPFLGAREDYGNKKYVDMRIHPDDQDKVNTVNKRKPTLGKWLKNKQKKNPS